MRFSVFAFGFSVAAITAPLTAQQVTESAPVAPVAQAQVATNGTPSGTPSSAVVTPASNAPVSPVASTVAPATVTNATTPVATPAATTGPTTETARAGIAPRESKTLTVNNSAATGSHVGAGQNVALMVVGGAALITGLVIGGDGGTLLAIGGAVVGLLGLYNFVK
jgi:hypothetical protein